MTATPTPAEIAASIINEVQTKLDTATLIDRARGSLDIPPGEVDENTVKVTDPVQAALINELLAQADELARIAKTATADREAIKELLEELLGDKEILVVHNAEVFTYKHETSRILNQKWVKAAKPDIAGNEDWYTTTERRTARFV